jgi:site-specific recombinase XerD
MRKYCPENEKKKRDYAYFLEAANGKQSATIDAALRAIERFELSTNRRPFRKFHVEQPRSFRARLIEELGQNGKPLSSVTVATTLKHLRSFFLWLSRDSVRLSTPMTQIISRPRIRICASPQARRNA